MLTPLIDKLTRRESLTSDETRLAMTEIMEGRASEAQIAGILIGLATKGETPDEILGLARSMRSHAVQLSRPFDDVFDCCGTGGDRSGTFNISSCVALVIAACGVRVAKHGNRSVSSACGSADVYEALGVNVAASPGQVERCLDQAGIAFFFAPTFHPSMRHAGPTRRALGVRTAFNLLGPLTNPARATRQLVGVPRPEFTDLLAQALQMLGSARAWVVHGSDGVDELSTTGVTDVSDCCDGKVTRFQLHPSDVGLPLARLSDLRGSDAAANAAIIRNVLNGEPGPHRDVVVLNAGAALLIAGKAPTVQDGIQLAASAIDEGKASEALARLVEFSAAPQTAGAVQ